jgi:hypothetical protein
VLSPDELVGALLRLGCVENTRHSRKNYRWLELRDKGRQIAIFNIPVARNPVPAGTLRRGILNPNGIRDEDHLHELLKAKDPPAAFRAVLPKQGPRYRPSGQL